MENIGLWAASNAIIRIKVKNKAVTRVGELSQQKKIQILILKQGHPSVWKGLNPYGLHDGPQRVFANSKKHSKR